jgi:L-2-hydroxyglutarate oxidase
VAFAKEHGVKHDICGKLIVATRQGRAAAAGEDLQHRQANGIEAWSGSRPEQIREIEPFCTGIAGVRVGCTGIIDFRGATEKMAGHRRWPMQRQSA